MEAWQLETLIHPALVKLVLGALMGDELDKILRDHYRAVIVDDEVRAGRRMGEINDEVLSNEVNLATTASNPDYA
jgi:hypothetical protein